MGSILMIESSRKQAKGHIMIQIKYAIVIVTYNREVLLRECIRQVTCQTVKAASIVIVNNASTDGTKAYLDELKAQSSIY
nr:glycosyltransferase [Lachnospiraceae bacterium]